MMNTRDEREQVSRDGSEAGHVSLKPRTVYKNLLALGLMNLLTHRALMPTNALISSRAGKMLGHITFGLNNVLSGAFSFLSVAVMTNKTSKKMAILLADVSIVGFALCNSYISYYSLIPGTVLFGFGLATSWIVSLIYVSKLAIYHARSRNGNKADTIRLFTGIIVAFSVGGYMIGNAATATVLTLLKSDDNSNNANYVDNSDNTNYVDNSDNTNYVAPTYSNYYTEHYYTWPDQICITNNDALEINSLTTIALAAVIVSSSVSALLVTLLFLDNLEKYPNRSNCTTTAMLSSVRQIYSTIISMGMLAKRKEMFMSIPAFFFSGVSVGFMLSSYTKVSVYSLYHKLQYFCVFYLASVHLCLVYYLTHLLRLGILGAYPKKVLTH